MISYLINGTKNSVFCCVFESFYKKEIPDVVTDDVVQSGFEDTVKKIEDDFEKGERVRRGLYDTATKNVLSSLDIAFKSGEKLKYTIIVKYLIKVFKNKTVNISKNFADQDVLAYFDMIRRIQLEVHRFKGFIRFQESKYGYYYAHYEPDNNITAMLMPHFCKRFKNQAFLIHDTLRNLMGMYDGKDYQVVELKDTQIDIYLSEGEEAFIKLWQQYYNSVNIEDRKNLKQMRNFMPERYWKNLPEKNNYDKNFD